MNYALSRAITPGSALPAVIKQLSDAARCCASGCCWRRRPRRGRVEGKSDGEGRAGGGACRRPRPGASGSSLPLFPQAPAGPGGAHGGPWPGPGLSPSWSGLRPLPSPSVLPGPVWFPEKTCLQFSGETEAGVRPLARADAAAEAPARAPPRRRPSPPRVGGLWADLSSEFQEPPRSHVPAWQLEW